MTLKRLLELGLLAICTTTPSGPVLADVYKFVTPNGQVIYTDQPRHRGYKLVIKTPARDTRPVTISLGSGRKLLPDVQTAMPAAPPMLVSAKLQIQGDKARNLDLRRMQYADLIERAAFRHGLNPALLHAVIHAESAYNPAAMSNKGAIGLMQLMPGTAARYGVRDAYDPEQNVFGGARYLRDLLGMFGSDVRLAVAAYNAGEQNVVKYGYQIPPFDETRNYVSKVLGYLYRYN